MNKKLKIIHDALKALEFDVKCDTSNSIVFTTCSCTEYAIGYDNDKQYFVVEHLTGTSFSDTWTANDALAIIGSINAKRMTFEYLLQKKSE